MTDTQRPWDRLTAESDPAYEAFAGKMLKKCAPEYEKVLKEHHWWVTHNGKTYRSLPKGHGRDTNPEVWTGHIDDLVDMLELDRDEARKVIPQLRPAKRAAPPA